MIAAAEKDCYQIADLAVNAVALWAVGLDSPTDTTAINGKHLKVPSVFRFALCRYGHQ
jgi:hypothetical protein